MRHKRHDWFVEAQTLKEENERMRKLICAFVLCECSQASYAELRGSQSMDISVEFLALCEFVEEMGVKLPGDPSDTARQHGDAHQCAVPHVQRESRRAVQHRPETNK